MNSARLEVKDNDNDLNIFGLDDKLVSENNGNLEIIIGNIAKQMIRKQNNSNNEDIVTFVASNDKKVLNDESKHSKNVEKVSMHKHGLKKSNLKKMKDATKKKAKRQQNTKLKGQKKTKKKNNSNKSIGSKKKKGKQRS